jgi:hypothetical protein
MIMAGAPRVGMKYYQEVAPGAAQDRAEVVSTTERCSVPAGTFESCLVTRETTPLEPDVKRGRAAYEVEIRLSDGRIVEVVVDASTGAVVGRELEDGDGWPRVRGRGRADD